MNVKPGQKIRIFVRTYPVTTPPTSPTPSYTLSNPASSVVTLHPPSGSDIILAAVSYGTGLFYAEYQFPLNAVAGDWVWRWQAIGGSPDASGLQEKAFTVLPLAFT